MSVTQRSYQEITERIVNLLEAGVVPWHKPWSVPGAEPQNLISGKAYRGINPFLLNLEPYASPFWVTFRQAQKLGGSVRKGERASRIWFWKFYSPSKDEESTETARQSCSRTKQIPILRRYSVFNVEQCDGLESHVPDLDLDEAGSQNQRIEAAQTIVEKMPRPPRIVHGRRAAFYQPSADLVGMPDLNRFEHAEAYYSTLFHELVHSTGHSSRLDREVGSRPSRFGSPTYSREELIAEMGAAFLAGQAGIAQTTIEASASYLDSWITRLQGDATLVVKASGAAQKAADYVLGDSGQA